MKRLLYIGFYVHFIISSLYGLFSDYESAYGISVGLFGDFIALACLGGAVGVPTVPPIIEYLGSANSSFLSTIFSTLFVIFLGYSSTVGVYVGIPAIFSFGYAVVWFQSSYNTQISYLEYVLGTSIFGITLAYSSIGFFAGGVLSSELVDLGLSVFVVEIIISLIFFSLTFIFCFYLIPYHREVELRPLQMEYKGQLEESRLAKLRKIRQQRRREQQQQRQQVAHHIAQYGSFSTSSTKNTTKAKHEKDHEVDEHSLFIEKDPETMNDSVDASSDSKISTTSSASALIDDADYYNLYLLTTVMLIQGLGTGMASMWSMSYVKSVWGTSSLIASLSYGGFQLSSAIVRFLFLDRLIMQLGRRSLVMFSMAGAGIFSIPFAVSGYYASSAGSLVVAILSLTIVGIFLGAVYPASMGIATRLYGFTTSFSFTVANSIGFLGGTMFSPIIYGNLIDVIGYSGAFIFQGGLYLIGAICGYYLTHDFLDEIYQERLQQ
jgi:MFS family permease